jgi:hypothetical protein
MASRYAKQIGASSAAGMAKTLIALAFSAKRHTERCEPHAGRSWAIPCHASPPVHLRPMPRSVARDWLMGRQRVRPRSWSACDPSTLANLLRHPGTRPQCAGL